MQRENKRRVCEIIGISRSTVYYKRKTPVEDPLEERVIEIFKQHNGNYGAARIKAVLSKEGEIISKRRIGRILKKQGLESKHGRRKLAKNVHTTTDERFIAGNLIKGQKATRSDEICQMDGSEFKHKGGKIIACGIIDVYDKTAVITCGNSENKELVKKTIKERLKTGIPEKLHSDRGSANVSLIVKELLEANEIKRSMSAAHRPNENQYIESFWKTVKTEIGDTRKLTREELIMVLEYYLYYYNNERIHSSIDYLTPKQKREISQGYP